MTIGERRPERQPDIFPPVGQYDPEKADKITKVKIIEVDFS